MNVDTPTLYTRQMSSIRRGCALFDPHPGYEPIPTGGLRQLPHTRPGDLGYVNMHGAFSRLFNIHLPEDDPEQSRTLPEYFQHIPLRPQSQQLRNFPVQVFRPVSVKDVKVSADLFLPAAVDGELSLAFKRQHGSFLAFFDQAWHDDVLMKAEYKQVLLQNHDQWLAFARQEDDSLRSEDLILVTGCDRARAWATAVCHSELVDGHVGLKVSISSNGPGAGFTCGMRWENSGGVEHNWGPSPSLAITQALVGPDASRRITGSESKLSGQPLNTKEDQCLFVRGFRYKRRILWPFRIRAAAEPKHLKNPKDDADAEYDEGASLSYTTDIMDYDGLSHPTSKQSSDCISNVLDYILENSDADVAIAHEDDLLPYIMDNEDATSEAILGLLPRVNITEYMGPDHTKVRLGSLTQERNNTVALSEIVSASSIDLTGLELFERQMDDADELFWENIDNRRHYNSLVSFLRLPTELICKIATLLGHPTRFSYFRMHDCVFTRLGWILLGHVCHALRAIILEHRILWATNIFTFPGAEDEFLRRSGEAPLHLSVSDTSRADTEKRIQFMINHLSRCATFRINSSWHPNALAKPHLDPTVFYGLNLPLLQHFELVQPSDSTTTSLKLFDRSSIRAPAIQSSELFDYNPIHAPALKTLVLCYVYVPFNAHNLTSLTMVKNADMPHLPEQHFLSMLRSCQSLQTLRLTNQVPPSLQSSLNPTIFLPVLREIEIDEDFFCSIALWSHLSVPPGATRTFKIRSVPSGLAETGQYIAPLHRHYQVDFVPPIDGFAVECYGQSHFVSIFLTHSPGAKLSSHHSSWVGIFQYNFRNVMSFEVHGSSLHFDRAVQLGSQIIDRLRIRYLELAGPHDGSTDDYNIERWATILQPFSAVHTLYVVGMPRSFFTAMAAFYMNASLLPSLRHMWINSPVGFDALLEFLQFRQRAGVALERLRVMVGRYGAEWTDEMLSQLRAVVPCVHTSKELEDPGIAESWHGLPTATEV